MINDFVKVYYNDIYDNRLSAGARLFLMVLRHRSASNNDKIDYDSIAKEFSCTTRTVRRWVYELKEFGYITSGLTFKIES